MLSNATCPSSNMLNNAVSRFTHLFATINTFSRLPRLPRFLEKEASAATKGRGMGRRELEVLPINFSRRS